MSLLLENIKRSVLSAMIYFPNTLKLVFFSFAISLAAGAVIAIVRFYKVPVLSWLSAAFVTLYQGVPVIVALLIFNLIFTIKLPQILRAFEIQKSPSDIDVIWIGIAALSLSGICSASEVFRGALAAVDPGQKEAGYSVGLTKVQTVRRIVIPQVVPLAVPPLLNLIVGLIKNSSVVMVIGIAEVFTGALIPASRSYSFLEAYIAVAVIYWGLTAAVEYLAGKAEGYLGRFRRTS